MVPDSSKEELMVMMREEIFEEWIHRIQHTATDWL
jgi:hypothetical protein